jgi:hypothetical protein
MGVGFGGNAVFNRASSSSHAGCVARIVQDDLPTGRLPRILRARGW